MDVVCQNVTLWVMPRGSNQSGRDQEIMVEILCVGMLHLYNAADVNRNNRNSFLRCYYYLSFVLTH